MLAAGVGGFHHAYLGRILSGVDAVNKDDSRLTRAVGMLDYGLEYLIGVKCLGLAVKDVLPGWFGDREADMPCGF